MTEYYWCFTHGTVEEGTVCKASDRLGPYASAQAARDWKDRVEERGERWAAEDERWHGEDDADG